jgi:fatty acid desaturase
MPKRPRPLEDLRAFRRREDRRLILIIMLFLVVVGGVAIGIVYGWSNAAAGALCLIGGAAVLGLVWLILILVERWARRE